MPLYRYDAGCFQSICGFVHLLVHLVICFQIEWLREGLLSVIPKAVLDLLTWQELEKRICGDPEVTVEALRRTSE